MSDRIKVLNNIILPSSFCSIKEGECFFRMRIIISTFYQKIMRLTVKSPKDLRIRYFSDEEMYSAVKSICSKNYNLSKPALLPSTVKIDLPRRCIMNTMHRILN